MGWMWVWGRWHKVILCELENMSFKGGLVVVEPGGMFCFGGGERFGIGTVLTRPAHYKAELI